MALDMTEADIRAIAGVDDWRGGIIAPSDRPSQAAVRTPDSSRPPTESIPSSVGLYSQDLSEGSANRIAFEDAVRR
ncbi:hypothetical protein [Actinomadura verrucosospora]